MDSLVDVNDGILDSPTGELGRVITLSVVSLACRFCMHVMNRTTVRGKNDALKYILEREEGQSLVTVANHTSTLDDPAIISAILPWRHFLQEANHKQNRWVCCAADICFTNSFLTNFFLSGKTLPLLRGGGMNQPVLDILARRVATHGEWMHVFPEGRISFDGRLGPLRWGVGKTICDIMAHTDRPPIVLPYYHTGMGAVMPYKARFPRMGHNVTVTIGDPVELSDLTCNCNKKGVNQQEVWRDITARIADSLQDLESRSVANVDQVKEGRAPSKFVYGNRKSEDAERNGPPPSPTPAV